MIHRRTEKGNAVFFVGTFPYDLATGLKEVQTCLVFKYKHVLN